MHAAGMTLKPENVPVFIEKFERIVSETIHPEMLIPKINIDATLELSKVTSKFYSLLKQFAPFGPENMNPIFAAHGVFANRESRIVGDNHLKLYLSTPDNPSLNFPAIGFHLGEHFDRAVAVSPLILHTASEKIPGMGIPPSNWS